MRARVHISVPLAVLATGFAASSHAELIAIQPRVSVGAQNYEVRFEDRTGVDSIGGVDFRDGFNAADQLSFFGGGLTFSGARFFADFSGQWSQTGNDDNVQLQGIEIAPGRYTAGDGQNHRSQTEFDREEFNASFGFGVTSNFSVYAGYKRATSDLTQTLTPILTPPPFVDTVGGRDGDVLFRGDYLIEFEYDGAFVGATYSIPVGTAGAFSIQSSVAQLDGEFTQRFAGTVAVTTPTGQRTIDPTFKDGTVEGDSVGVNIGVAWTGNVGNFSYTIGIDHSQYEFDASKSQALWAADFEEKNLRARLDLRYRFNLTSE
jgi:hypothetical protein